MTQKGKPPNSTSHQRQQSEQRSAGFLKQFSLIAGILLFAGFIGDALLYFDVKVWQILLDITLSSIPGITASIIAYYFARRQKVKAAAYAILSIGLIFFPLSLTFLAGREWPTLAAGLVGFLVAVTLLWPDRWLAWVTASGAYIAYMLGIMQLNLVERYDVAQNASQFDIAALSSGLFVVLVLWLSIRAFYSGSIRIRLLIAFIALASLPLILVAAYLSFIWSQDLQDRIINQLESVATLKEAEIDTWLGNLHGDLTISLTGADAIQRAETLLQGASDNASYQDAYGKLAGRFRQNITQLERLEEIFLLDPQGQVILSTDPAQEGKIHAQQDYFRQGLAGQSFVQPPFYSPSLGKTSLIVSRPVRNKGGEVIAVLAGRASLQRLNEIMQERSGLGDTGETYLIGANHALLTDSRFPEYSAGKTYIHTVGANAAVDNRQSGSDVYNDYRGEATIGAYRWIPGLEVGLLSKLDLSEARRNTNTILMITAGVVFLSILIAVAVAFWVTRGIVNPLDNLAQTAVQIAGGNLKLRAAVEREDEVGAVAEAFNSMTAQLRNFIDTLEERVTDRTQRLEIVAALSERLTAILDFDQLLLELVNQVKESFNYYHAHIYIIDKTYQNLVMTAGVGKAGAQMKAGGHSIPLNAPASLVARAARSNQIVSVDNVREAPDWLPNPLLPDTHSEMAVPINVEGQVVGVLDVQSENIAGLDEGDANLLRSLANQVAVAIRNARLFEQVEGALSEAHAAQERYLTASWQQVKAAPSGGKHLYLSPGVASVNDELLKQRQRLAFDQKQSELIATDEGDRTEGKALVAPVILHGMAVGSLQVGVSSDAPTDTEEDLIIIQTIAEQLAQSAENLRLFDETRERAGFERLVSDITHKLRQSSSLEALAKTAAEELGSALGASRSLVSVGQSPDQV